VAEEDGSLTTTPWILTYNTSETANSVRVLTDSDFSFDIAAMGHGTPITENGSEALVELARRSERTRFPAEPGRTGIE
jgi:hypothetical protein